MKFVEKFPDPGPPPPVPGAEPSMGDSEKWNAWNKEAHAYNGHLTKLRKHMIARSVDVLSERSKSRDWHLDPAANISLTLGIMFLEGSFEERDPLNIFASFF
jgi:hypothetical protein